MSLIKVEGSDCLKYVDKPIGFSGLGMLQGHIGYLLQELDTDNGANPYGDRVHRESSDSVYQVYTKSPQIDLLKFEHNANKRIIGYVVDEYEDGGLEIYLLGDEPFDFRNSNMSAISEHLIFSAGVEYEQELLTPAYNKKGGYQFAPDVSTTGSVPTPQYNKSGCALVYSINSKATFDMLLNFQPEYYEPSMYPMEQNNNRIAFNFIGMSNYMLTDDIEHTIRFGHGLKNTNLHFDGDLMADNNILTLLSGDLYSYFAKLSQDVYAVLPNSFENGNFFEFFEHFFSGTITSTNCSDIPYNLILTKNYNFAKAYLDNGTIPPDAFLYPLDWENLPTYTPSDDNPQPDPDDNEPDDNSRIVVPDDFTPPSVVPSQLCNYNWYWITAPQYEAFLNWFWNDVGDVNDWDSLVGKIEGLYNDLASAILMVRYFPIDNLATWIGGLGNPATLKIGMVEQANTSIDTISKTSAPILRNIGSYTVEKKYKSFVDLAPYTQISLYLPFYGFVDLDIDIFMSSDKKTNYTIDVKAVYDHLNGTIQYFILYNNKVLVNSFTAKMAVDVPISLQSKNDRDSAIFNNVGNAVAGLVGAGSSLATGNPIGMVLGAGSILNSGSASAPLNVKGTIGETGAFYQPTKCKIILRQPTLAKPTTWSSEVGQMCGRSYTLGSKDIVGSGLTICYKPKIYFTESEPLQDEVDEIYTILQEGVIL